MMNKYDINDIVVTKDDVAFKVMEVLEFGPGTIFYIVQRLENEIRRVVSEHDLKILPTKQSFNEPI